MALVIKQQCIIQATPDKVFAHLTDFVAYRLWNPWIINAEGRCAVGETVQVQAKLGDRIGHYGHTILAVEAPSYFHWCDQGWFTRLAYGERIRHLEAHAEGTFYRVELRVTGVMARLVEWLYGTALEQGLAAETQALKQRVESNE